MVDKKIIRVKLLAQWLPPHEVGNAMEKFSKGKCRWNDIELVGDDENIDYYCILNQPYHNGIKYIPSKTIYIKMEPIFFVNVMFNQEWRNIDKNKFFYVMERTNGLEWHLGKTYTQLSTEPIEKTKLLSTVVSSKYDTDGQQKRIHFMQYLDKQNYKFDLFGVTNAFNLSNYIGHLPNCNKNDGILFYKYSIACENTQEMNYFTEKIIDCILGECVCFYWGCPNISDYIDSRAYILLDLDDFPKSFNIIKESIANNEWEKRIDIIKQEKHKILNKYHIFPTLETIIKNKDNLESLDKI